MKCLYQISNSELFRYSFMPIDAKMYVLISGNRALIVDPCIDQDALNLLKKREIRDIIILPTHEHYDHISGINWLKDNFNCKVIAIEECARNLYNPKLNISAHFEVLFLFHSEDIQRQVRALNVQPYLCYADEVLKDELSFSWEEHKVEIIKTPGHSQGSVCTIIDDKYVFTGDSFIFNLPTITRLPGGSQKDFENISIPFLKNLSPTSMIFPGHGDMGIISKFKVTEVL
ncbi:MAG: MBL fold metallo-hydrolase [Bacilli bacterium]|nr:MBL fold metallo-hydrolase [Bacilli bacterium]